MYTGWCVLLDGGRLRTLTFPTAGRETQLLREITAFVVDRQIRQMNDVDLWTEQVPCCLVKARYITFGQGISHARRRTMAPVRTRLTAIMNVMSWLKVARRWSALSTSETPPSRTYIV